MTNQVKFEIETSTGTWLDITSDVYQRDTVTISRGKSDEQSQAQPQRMSFTLDNRDGKFSPRNPLSPLFGAFGRNTPVRLTENTSYIRFYGEITGVDPQWNENHSDNFIQVEAYGILRRLGQGQPVVSTALRDWVLQQPTLAAYYPLSGGEETIYSQNVAPGKTGSFFGSKNAVFTYGVDMGAAWLGTGMQINATGDIPYLQGVGNAVGTNIALDFVFQSLAMGVLDVQIWPGVDEIWNLRLNTSGDDATLQVSWNDGNGGVNTALPTGVIGALQDTEIHTCRFELHLIAGPLVEYFVYIDGVLVDNVAGLGGQALSRCPFFRFHYSRFVNQTYVNVAHLALWADNTAANLPTPVDYTAAAMSYAGDLALTRLSRVCADGDIPITINGTAAESPTMGPQFSETRLETIRDCETTDMGLLLENRSAGGLLYQSRASLYNKTPAFTLDYAAGQVVPPLQPTDDDQSTRNDVTATKREGGSARYTVDTGPMSTLDAPAGVGRYATEVTVNTETDGMLDDVAAWVANQGTLDKARWPQVTVNLNSPNVSAALANQVRTAEVGDWFTIKNLQKAFVYDDVALVIVGYSETITPFVHLWTANCMAADPYTVVSWATSSTVGSFHWDSDGSELNSTATATATSLSVKRSTGATSLWTTQSDAFPFDILVGGERMTVNGISGATSPQTFSPITRSVNGVVKSHAAGTDVRLFNSPTWAL